MTMTYVVVSSSDDEPIREGYEKRSAAETRAAELQADTDDRIAVAEMPAEDYAEFARCGNRSATFTRAELAALGVI